MSDKTRTESLTTNTATTDLLLITTTTGARGSGYQAYDVMHINITTTQKSTY
ncbi:hypothetical protein DPMN_153938 [Dreissena polymorpha]|uniref:Uncharacterized protein n=1 Tax=Dreissena polymorpha TaxID=45954 RepID=A0A9D4FK80_DREPO|nr:hypothetical protein DPMN_153938 [Dreissena polymorpha]